MKVIKRDNTTVEFDIQKIYRAIDGAFVDTTGKEAPNSLQLHVKEVFDAMPDDTVMHVEEVQDRIEEILMDRRYHEVAKEYILYRERHKEERLLRERLEYMDNYAASGENAATSSETDANANVGTKNVANLNGEVYKTINRKIQRYRMRKQLKVMYPWLEKQYEEDLENHIIYTHDESSTPVVENYCEAVSMYPFFQYGTSTLDGTAATAPKNMSSFAGQFVNLVFLLAAQCKGACLYKNQTLIVKEDGVTQVYAIKNLIEKHFRTKPIHVFENFQGKWEYVNVDNLEVAEDGKFVRIHRLYRRTYDGKILRITSNDNVAEVSQDHVFKQFLFSRVLEQKSKYLEVNDTVFMNKDLSFILNTDSPDWKKGWMIGLICGDGHIGNDGKHNLISIAINYRQRYLSDIYNAYSEEIFNKALNLKKGHRCYELNCHDKDYYNKIQSYIIGKNAYDKHIDIKGKSVDFLLGFLDGLFTADGSYTEKRGVTISVTNKDLAQNIHDILKLIGLANTSITVIPPRGNRRESYSQYVPARIMKYLYHTLSKKLLRSDIDVHTDDRYKEVYHYGHNAFRNISKGIGLGYRNKWSSSKAAIRYNSDVITNIEEFDNDDAFVYEIETDTHWYNCGGFITHNCAVGEFFNAYDYYCVQDFGPDYHLRSEELASIYPRKTIGQVIDQYFQQIVYSINQPAGNRSFQSPFTNFSYYDSNYWHALFDSFSFPDGTKPQWERVSFLQKRFMKWLNRERTKTMLTFPVETMALLSDGKDIMDQEYKEFTAEMYAEGHSFFTYISDNPNALASCCRLRNEMTDNVFSFTNGLTGVQTGSANVITLNMNRIIQDCAKRFGLSRDGLRLAFAHGQETDQNWSNIVEKNIEKHLTEILEKVYCYHKAYKTLLYEVEKQGLLSASNAGYISMSRLYSTIGINGINEAAEFAGLKCSYNEGYKRFCRLITGIISRNNKEQSKDKAFLFNQEFVPAEGLSSKNYRWDKADGYWVPEDRVLYNSYFYLADDPDTSVLEKFRLHGREFTELLDGGVGLHCNLEEHLSKTQYLKLIDFAIANGTTYFTFNIPNSECSNPSCHHIIKTPLDVCPKCGSPMRLWTRIIGYMRPLDNYDYFRKIEAMRRHYAKKVE